MCSTVGRRQAILDALMCRRRDTMANLATEFGVTERTIRREFFTRQDHTALRDVTLPAEKLGRECV